MFFFLLLTHELFRRLHQIRGQRRLEFGETLKKFVHVLVSELLFYILTFFLFVAKEKKIKHNAFCQIVRYK